MEYTHVYECKACEGLGRVPAIANWRPFEASKETVQAAAYRQSCNLHSDCEAANERARKAGQLGADHCHDDCCEDCFGC